IGPASRQRGSGIAAHGGLPGGAARRGLRARPSLVTSEGCPASHFGHASLNGRLAAQSHAILAGLYLLDSAVGPALFSLADTALLWRWILSLREAFEPLIARG